MKVGEIWKCFKYYPFGDIHVGDEGTIKNMDSFDAVLIKLFNKRQFNNLLTSREDFIKHFKKVYE